MTPIRILALLLLLQPTAAFALPKPQINQSPDLSPPGVLIGDLITGVTTGVGSSIANILVGLESGQSSIIKPSPVQGNGPGACKSSKDPCCIWYQVSMDLSRDFGGKDGKCNDQARAAIRLGFHDAGTWSQALAAQGQDFGGADGSLVLFKEISRKENRGLEEIVEMAKKYSKRFGVGMADLIQYMAVHAVVTCPLGPRVRAFVGRKDATRAAPEGLLPSISSSADTLIALFADKTISAHDLVALVGAHSTSKQFTQSPSQIGAPQDTTPGVWDVSFYNETIQPKAASKVFRFASDAVISKDSRCSNEWNAFLGNQEHWNEDYAKAYVRLSLLGVNNINNLTECSATLPAARIVTS